MAGELIGGLIELAIEGVAEASSSRGKDNDGCGCLIIVIILLMVGGWFYYDVFYREKEIPLKGLITKKLSDNRVLVRTTDSEDVYTITNELYLNKKSGDSITIINNDYEN